MEPYRAHRTRSQISGLACFTALLGIAMLSPLNVANAADGRGGGDTALSVMRGPGPDQSDLGSVVLRGTRPPRPNASQPSLGEGGGNARINNAFQQGPSNPYDQRQNNTFQQGPLSGSGWDTRFDYGGLCGTYFSQ